MSSELARFEMTESQKALVFTTVCNGVNLDRNEFDWFLYQCEHLGLNPLLRQVYPLKSKGKLTVITGIDGFRAIAQRTGAYRGQRGPEWLVDGKWVDYPDNKCTACKVGILRDGFDEPVWGVVSRQEFGGRGMHQSLPAHMLAVRAESHGLRKAFPDELAGAYTQDEMEGVGVHVEQPGSTRKQVARALQEWSGIRDTDELKQAMQQAKAAVFPGHEGDLSDEQVDEFALAIAEARNSGTDFFAFVQPVGMDGTQGEGSGVSPAAVTDD